MEISHCLNTSDEDCTKHGEKLAAVLKKHLELMADVTYLPPLSPRGAGSLPSR
jgi:hypothetical protein